MQKEKAKIQQKLSDNERIPFLENLIEDYKNKIEEIDKELESRMATNTIQSNATTNRYLEELRSKNLSNLKEELKATISQHTLSVKAKHKRGNRSFDKVNSYQNNSKSDSCSVVIPKLKIFGLENTCFGEDLDKPSQC